MACCILSCVIREAIWAREWKMNVVCLCYFMLILDYIILSCKTGCQKCGLSRSVTGRAHNKALSTNQLAVWVKVCTWRIKLQVFYWRHPGAHLDTTFEPGEILATLDTMFVTHCPKRSFSSASNARSSNLGNTNSLQNIGKTCWPALQSSGAV